MLSKKILLVASAISLAALVPSQNFSQKKINAGVGSKSCPVWNPDNGDGTYRNPIIFADYSDPDVIRSGSDYFLVSSSFVNTPGLPVLHSKDLVNWKIVNHVTENIPYGDFKFPMHGNGIWAPSIRFHNGEYFVFYGDPDYGIFMSKTKNPLGKWEPLKLVKAAKGWIDPCPFWDDGGNAYLVHAWAKSRSGIKSKLTINKLSEDGLQILDEGVLVYDGTEKNPTIEGPKLCKQNGYYYIFAPAGGVTGGWQTVLRSKNIYGPYEEKVVLEQGKTGINGPHQGAWVQTQTGESWFVHFQDRDAYGRIILLEPMKWIDGWPVIGIDNNGNGIGEPVLNFRKPNTGNFTDIQMPQTSDEFDSSQLGLQWQWEANHSNDWYSLTASKGKLRLFSVPLLKDSSNIYNLPNVLGQKFPAPQFTATAKLNFNPVSDKEKAGIVVLGKDYAALTISRSNDGFALTQSICLNASGDGKEETTDSKKINSNSLFLRIYVREGGVCSFCYSLNGKIFEPIGKEFFAKKGMWVGARIGIFSTAEAGSKKTGYADFDWFRISK